MLIYRLLIIGYGTTTKNKIGRGAMFLYSNLLYALKV